MNWHSFSPFDEVRLVQNIFTKKHKDGVNLETSLPSSDGVIMANTFQLKKKIILHKSVENHTKSSREKKTNKQKQTAAETTDAKSCDRPRGQLTTDCRNL